MPSYPVLFGTTSLLWAEQRLTGLTLTVMAHVDSPCSLAFSPGGHQWQQPGRTRGTLEIG